MDRLISEQAVLKQLKGCLTGGEAEYQYVKLHIDSIPSAEPYKGMTNMEVIKMLFPDPNKIDGEFRFTKKWGDRPYEPQESEDKE